MFAKFVFVNILILILQCTYTALEEYRKTGEAVRPAAAEKLKGLTSREDRACKTSNLEVVVF